MTNTYVASGGCDLSKPSHNPGAMGNDALICRHMGNKWVPIAGLRDADTFDGTPYTLYGSPIFRKNMGNDFQPQLWLETACRLQQDVFLQVSHRLFGNVIGRFRVVSCHDDELSLRQVD